MGIGYVCAIRGRRTVADNVRGRAEDGSQEAMSLTSGREGLHVIIADMWDFCKGAREERAGP